MPFRASWADMSAAQLAVILAALQDREVGEADSKQKPLKEQPRVSRSVMLELAKRTNQTVVDAKAE